MTDSFTFFQVLNIVSGFTFIALGALAALRPNARSNMALALFLMAWGAQIALTNLAATQSLPLAFTLYLFGAGFLPLQATFILLYAAENTRNVLMSGFARIGALLVLGLGMAGLVVAVWPGSHLLTVARDDSGVVQANLGSLSLLFFDAPQFLGVSFAFLQLAGTSKLDSPKSWRLLGGLTAAWAATVAYPTVSEFEYAHFSPLFIVLALALAVTAAAAAVMLLKATRRSNPAYAFVVSSSILLAGALAGLSVHFSNNVDLLYAIAGPGVFRLLASSLIVAGLWLPRIEWDLQHALPVSIIVGCSLVAATISTISILAASLSGVWQAVASWTALAALAVIVVVAIRPTMQGLGGVEAESP